jgi:hypothetical protein
LRKNDSGTTIIEEVFWPALGVQITGYTVALTDGLMLGTTPLVDYGTNSTNLLIESDDNLVTVMPGGNFLGDGVFSVAQTINSGTIEPGGPDDIGVISFTADYDYSYRGNYTQTASGTLMVELQATGWATNNSQIQVSGNVALNGSLNVTFAPGFSPYVGDTFDIVENSGGNAISGQFAGLKNGTVFNVGGLLPTDCLWWRLQRTRRGVRGAWDPVPLWCQLVWQH